MMMDWVGAGLLVLLVPMLMCAVMMGGGVALAVFGFRRAGADQDDRRSDDRDWLGEPSEPLKDRS